MIDEELKKGLEYGFMDDSIVALKNCSPRLLTNDFSKKEKILSSISTELYDCDEFMFSVAFITEGGVNILLNELKCLKDKGIRGRIVASQYQNFTQPKALKKISSFDNIELKIVTQESKMHTKCYIFRKGNSYNVIIGSSNLTAGALCNNEEWNLRFSSMQDGAVVKELVEEFDSMFHKATPINDVWIGQYSEIYNTEYRFRTQLRSKSYSELENTAFGDRINPNTMQVNALESLDDLRKNNKTRALLISATGTGKTYLSAFDVKKVNPNRFLFVVHRETILKKAMESYRKVIGSDKTMGLLTGGSKDFESDYIFASIQTLSQDHVLNRFESDHFDYIVIDEAHHGGAETYRKILDYFHPKFLLGMTATPERNDSFDIFKMFNYDIAYEIRLQQAMEFDMVCPFHYFGIGDIKVNNVNLDNKEDFTRLVSNERFKHIIQNVNYFGYSGDRVKGLVFCRNVDEAEELSKKFNSTGYKTEFLSSKTSQDDREFAIEKLESDNRGDSLDYLFVVDLFNEGVDIPSINQIVMLRPTESPIVFVQQLGRGLRRHDNKEYVVVIDFIGNYENNYLIPIALSGDRSYNKDDARRFVVEGNREIPGTSVISFDSVAKEKIYNAIDNKDFNEIRLIRESYDLLKKKLGKIPSILDFEKFGSIDALKFIEIQNFGSYHNFLRAYDKDYSVVLSEMESTCIKHLSYLLCPGKRVHELLFVRLLMTCETNDIMHVFMNELHEKYNLPTDRNLEANIVNLMSGRFFNKHNFSLIEKSAETYRISESFSIMLKNPQFHDMLEELLKFGMGNYLKKYSKRYLNMNFALYQKYTYADVCRLLNWSKDLNGGAIGGYCFDKNTNTFPVFINYVKGEDIVESQRYEDRFLNQSVLIAAPKSTDNRNSSRMTHVEKMKEEGIVMPLFVRKNKKDKGSKEFYYLGNINFDKFLETTGSFMIRYILDVPVRQDIYDYLST